MMPRDALRRGATIFALIPLLVLLWSLTHHYLGLGGDARLYAVQAMARAHANLFNDLYLQNTSQDSYTLFSSLYLRCIELIGLRNAALTLTLAFKVLFFASAWVAARRLFGGACAFAAVTLLILTAGRYGAFGVFHYAEDWLTARSVAEALVVSAIACLLYGRPNLGLLIACGAMLLHPLVALPGLLWLICLRLPFRLGILGAAAGILAALGVAGFASWQPSTAHPLIVMDAAWLEVVRERSQFLFLQLWRADDWSLNARPFLSLSLSVLALEDVRSRKAGAAAMLVGGAGLAIALIGSVIGPVSVLLQGQAWRWVWVAGFASVLLLAPTILAVWRAERVGPLCVLLLTCAWTFSTTGGTICLVFAWMLWMVRDCIHAPAAKFLHGMWILLTLALVVWTMTSAWTMAWLRPGETDDAALALIGELPGLKVLLFAVVGAIAYWIRSDRPVIVLSLTIAALVAACVYCLPRAFHDASSVGTVAEIDEYSDWRRAIPPNANVLVAPARNSAAFAWFTLQRPSYLTVDQSSGVVFSRATALEVRRRSKVLLPLMDPDWRLLSHKSKSSIRPLTRQGLTSICGDPQLGFVVAAEDVGFEPLRHSLPGGRHNWYLYDCRIVNLATPSA